MSKIIDKIEEIEEKIESIFYKESFGATARISINNNGILLTFSFGVLESSKLGFIYRGRGIIERKVLREFDMQYCANEGDNQISNFFDVLNCIKSNESKINEFLGEL